jgi:hypothetical protein
LSADSLQSRGSEKFRGQIGVLIVYGFEGIAVLVENTVFELWMQVLV